MDLKKAFDCVNRKKLFLVLKMNNVGGRLLKSIENMYDVTLNAVKVNLLNSEWFSTTCGVKQGDNLSPLLFNVYINGLLEKLSSMGKGITLPDGGKVCALAFADDIVIISESPDELQLMLNTLTMWCMEWDMTVNTRKTQIVVFGQNSDIHHFFIGSYEINIVSEYKYLGITLDSQLNFHSHVTRICLNARKAFGMISRRFSLLLVPQYKVLTRVMFSFIYPILTYGIALWGNSYTLQKIDQVIHEVQRRFLGVNRSTPIAGIELLMNWPNANNVLFVESCRQYNRLVCQDSNRYSKQVFPGSKWKVKFFEKIPHFIDDQDLSIFFQGDQYDSCINVQLSKKMCLTKQRRTNMVQARTCSKLDILVECIDELSEQDNWSIIFSPLNSLQRGIICKLLLGTLSLRVESGRIEKLTRCDRICELCLSDVETQCHFLFKCPLLKSEQKNMWRLVTNSNQNYNLISYVKKLVIYLGCPFIFAKQLLNLWDARVQFLNLLNDQD